MAERKTKAAPPEDFMNLPETEETVKESTEKHPDYVEIKLPLLKGHNARQEEFYSVNFRNYLIKRGEYVKIPYELYLAIKDQENDEEAAFRFAESAALREA